MASAVVGEWLAVFAKGKLSIVRHVDNLILGLLAERNSSYVPPAKGAASSAWGAASSARGAASSAPTREESEEITALRGAYLLPPQPRAGILKNVHVADFTGMYPSIAISFNISPETKVPWLPRETSSSGKFC